MKRSHVAAVAALALVVPATVSGCFNGPRATTTVQATMNSGNGVEVTQGALDIENATLVLGPEGSRSATLLMRVTNVGLEPDTLTYLTINGTPSSLSVNGAPAGAGVEIGPGQSLSFGFESTTWANAYDLDVEPSSWVPVELGFENAGLASFSVLSVPAVGQYAGIAPNPPMAPAAAS